MDLFCLLTGGAYNMGNLITNLLFTVCTVILLGELGRSSRTIVRRVVDGLLLIALQTALDVVFQSLLAQTQSMPSLFLMMTAYALLQTRLTPIDRVVRCATFMALFVITVSMTGMITTAFSLLRRLSFGYSIPSAISYAAMFFFVFLLRRFSVERFSFIPSHYVVLILLTDVAGAVASNSFITTYSYYLAAKNDSYLSIYLMQFEQSFASVNLFVNVSFIMLISISYVMFHLLAKEHDERAELLVTKRSEEDSADMANLTQRTYEQLREMRHEIKNHDAYMKSLLDAGEYEELKDFFEVYSADHAEVLHHVSCGNRTVDAVVNSKIALAQSRGIEVKTMLAVPSELPFSAGDLYSLLANLLDNAIEGTSACGREDEGIRLSIRPEGDYYFFTATNPCDPRLMRRTRGGVLLTSKSDDDVHGYGTRVISRIAEKYQGSARFTAEGKTFVANVMLAGTSAE